jgi:hypothetical protein
VKHRRVQPRKQRRTQLLALATPLGIIASGALVWQSSYSAFTATTNNPSNTFSAGTVSLTDDDTGSAMFNATGLKPGSTGTACIKVTYNGSLAAAVKMYVASGDLSDSGLGPYLNFTVQEGTGGQYGNCTGFASSATDVNNQALSTFAGASTNYASGVGSWAPTGSAQTKVYQFPYTVAGNNSAQGTSATVKFTWEADNT